MYERRHRITMSEDAGSNVGQDREKQPPKQTPAAQTALPTRGGDTRTGAFSTNSHLTEACHAQAAPPLAPRG